MSLTSRLTYSLKKIRAIVSTLTSVILSLTPLGMALFAIGLSGDSYSFFDIIKEAVIVYTFFVSGFVYAFAFLQLLLPFSVFSNEETASL